MRPLTELLCLPHSNANVSRVFAVLSPAKKLNFDAATGVSMTTPELLSETRVLAETTRRLKTPDVKKLMKLSDSLATLNFNRFQEFDTTQSRPKGCKQAALAFDGDTYTGLKATEFNTEELKFAQIHLGILSGLYGVLRPLDAIQPYRLEMGTKLKNPRGKSLYDFWGDRVTKQLNKRLKKAGSETLINLASNEYFSVVLPEVLQGQIITPVFKENRGGTLKIISFSAKRARGTMARYIIENRLTEPEALKKFKLDGYSFSKSGSSESEYLFVRQAK